MAAFQAALKLDSEHAEIWSALGHAYAVSGNKPEARKILAKLEDPAALSYVAPYNVAVVYAGLGEDDAAFLWLEQRVFAAILLFADLSSNGLAPRRPAWRQAVCGSQKENWASSMKESLFPAANHESSELL